MKNIKKILLLLVLILGIALASCNGKTVEGTLTINYGAGMETKKVTAEEYSKDLLTVEKAGYKFLGWFLDSSYTKVYVTEDKISGNVTIYGKWETIEYGITYHLNGGANNSNNPAKYTVEDKVTLLDPTKEECTFKGWYTEESLTNKVTEIAKGTTGNKDFYAKWEEASLTVEYDITYNLDGGTNASTNPSKYTSEDEVILASPSKNGYTFAGWMLETGAPITKIEKGTTGPIVLIATWTQDILVSFVVDNETVKTVNITNGEQVTLPSNPSKTGYDFDGWYVGENEFNAQQTFTESVTVIAKFTVQKFDVKFYVGTELVDTKQADYNSPTNALPNDPSKTGYEFAGWYLEDNTAFNAKNTLITKDTNVYAKFEAIEYTIEYDLDGGTNNANNPTKYTIEDELVFEDPTKEGYTFTGWTGKAGEPVPRTVKGSYGNIYRKAHWTQDVIVSFVVENETVKTVNLSKGEALSLPSNPSKTGYDFNGWYVGDDEFNTSATLTESVTVTAKFTIKKFDVKFYVDDELFETLQAEYNSPTNGLPAEEPTKTGLEFAGWYLEDGTAFSAKETLITKATNVYARFNDPSASQLKVSECVGANEAIYLKMNVVDGYEVNDYKVYYLLDNTYIQIDSQLVRKISGETEYIRADILGLKADSYNVKVQLGDDEVIKKNIVVSALDRSGYAHFNYENGVGAYNNDGTLKDNAVVVYVNEANKNTVTAKIGTSTKTGLAAILKAATNESIPVNVRILGTVGAATWKSRTVAKYSTATTTTIQGANGQYLQLKTYEESDIVSGGFNELDESTYTKLNGLTNKIKYDSDKKEYDSYYNMLDISNARNVTVEGVGDDAQIFQWGFTWKSCTSIEVRNLKFDDYTEDACSFEGGDDSTTLAGFKTGHIWLHHNTFEKGVNYWDVCSEQDKHDGDGSTDFKKLAYVTISYNHYIKNHKTGLVGGSDTQHTACLTFHHNFYDECESRLPFARQANMHMYNNYYYKSSGNNMQIYAGAYAFIENCYFDNVKKTFEIKTSDGKVAAVKSYNNTFDKCTTNGATVVESRTATVTNGNLYGQTFDTDSTMFYYDAVNKKSNVSILNDTADVPAYVALHAGSGSGYYSSLELYSTVIVKHTVTFKYSDGTTVKDYGTLAVADGASAAEPEFDVEGYALVGWYSDADLTKSFSFNTEITDDITVYAKVRELELFTIDFIYKIGTAEEVTISTTSVYEGQKVTKPSNPTLTGYTFDDWYTDLSYETKFNFDSKISKDTVVYAKFVEESTSGSQTNIIKTDANTPTSGTIYDAGGITVTLSGGAVSLVEKSTTSVDEKYTFTHALLPGGGNRSYKFVSTTNQTIVVYYTITDSSWSNQNKQMTKDGTQVTSYSSSNKCPGATPVAYTLDLVANTECVLASDGRLVIWGYEYSTSSSSQTQSNLLLNMYSIAQLLPNTSAGNGQYPANHVKTLYKVGESFNSTYLTVTTGYVDADECTFAGFDSTTTGSKNVTVTYNNETGTLVIYVLPANFTISNDDNGYYVAVGSSYDVGGTTTINNKTYTTFKTINQALDAFSLTNVTPTSSKRAYVKVLAGYYNEKVVISVPYLTIEGAGITKATYSKDESFNQTEYNAATIIEWDSLFGKPADGGNVLKDDANHITDSTQTLYIMESAVNCEIKNLTISNANNCYSYFTDVVKSHSEHRALALLVQADKVILNGVALLGYQDTVEFFAGRHYLTNCYITGATDYIFGTNGTTYITKSTIHTVYNGSNTQGGFVNAFKGENSGKGEVVYGCIYDDCIFEADNAVANGMISLGRPWTECSSVMIMNSTISAKYSTASTQSASVGRYCNWNNNTDGPKAANAKFYEYNNDGDGAITQSKTGCTVLTDATLAANYSNFTVIYGKTNGEVKYSTVWDGTTNPVVDTNIYYYFDGTATTSGYTFTGEINRTTGTFGDMTIDATNGKLYARTSDTQMAAGTIITFTVTKAATVTITFNHWQEAYTVNGVASTDGVYSIDVEAGTTITFVATAESYLKSIIIS